MDLRQYLQVFWRRKVVIASTILLGAVVAGLFQQTVRPTFSATTELLLLPRDPSERVSESPGGPFDLQRYVSAQVSVLQSRETAQVAAAMLPGVEPEQVLAAVTAKEDAASDIVFVTATDPSAQRAAQIANAVAEGYIATRRESDVQSLRNAAQEIGIQLDALSVRLDELRRQAATQDAAVAADLEAANLQFTSLYGRQQDLLIDSTLKRGEARVIEPAIPPLTPDGTSLPVAIALGALLGAMVGLAFAYVRDQFDDRLRSTEEVEQLTGLPVLTEIPVDARLSDRDVLASDAAPMGAVAEAFRSLRTGVSFLGVDEPIRRVLVTSAVPGEGKTFVATHFAAACAQAGFRTVLVSADLRRPRLESYFHLDEALPGLTHVLSVPRAVAAADAEPASVDQVRTALERAIQPTGTADLFVVPSGPCPPNPAEMLASPRMADILLLLEQSFDLVVLDTSPVVPVADALALAPTVGNVLLVTSHRTSRRREVQYMTRAVGRTNARVLGLAVNRASKGRGATKGYGTEAVAHVEAEAPAPQLGLQDGQRQPAAEPARSVPRVAENGSSAASLSDPEGLVVVGRHVAPSTDSLNTQSQVGWPAVPVQKHKPRGATIEATQLDPQARPTRAP